MTESSPLRVALALSAWALAGACSGQARTIGLPEEQASSAGGSTNDVPASAGNRSSPERDPPPKEAHEPPRMPPDAGAYLVPIAWVPFAPPRGACAISDRVGRFTIERQVDFGVVQGTIAEGVVPTSVPELVVEQGTCKLLERRTLGCLPPCVGAETCGEAGQCIPYPRQLSVGDVHVSGLTRETRMAAQVPGNAYFSPGADNPPFAVLSEIVLQAEGAGELPAFALFGVGSEPLAQAPRWLIEAGADLLLSWARAGSDAGTTVAVELTIDQHGVSPLSLGCEFEDSGSAVVPASLIDQMIGSGVSGFPNGRIMRRTADHVELGVGCVELLVGSPLPVAVAVAGHTPCNVPADCPAQQSCNVPLQRCE